MKKLELAIQNILGKYDFQRLIGMGAPGNEYYPETKEIVHWLEKHSSISVDELTVELHCVFVRMFSPRDVGLPEQYRIAAQEIFDVWHRDIYSII